MLGNHQLLRVILGRGTEDLDLGIYQMQKRQSGGIEISGRKNWCNRLPIRQSKKGLGYQ